MKKLSLPVALILFGLGFSSCNKDDDSAPNPAQAPDTFSELTVEQNKTNIEDNGIAMVNKMNELKSSSAIETSINLSQLLELNDPLSDDTMLEPGRLSGSTSKYSIVQALAGLGQGTSGSKEIFETLKTSTAEAPETPQEIFDDAAGTYTWNTSTQDWDAVEGGNKIIFKFPSTETGTTNNATYTVHSYSGITGTPNPLDADYAGDLPSGLAVDLAIDGNVVLEYGFAGAYNANGEPTSFSTFLTLTPFKFVVTLTNNSRDISAKYSLTHNESILMDMGIGVNGNFTTEAIENSTDESEYLNSGYAYFQMLDIKLSGDVNIKALIEENNKIYSEEYDDMDFDYDAATVQVVESFNRNVNLVLYYVAANAKIAETEFYVMEEEVLENCDYEYNYETGEWMTSNCETGIEKTENIRLVFADESKSDLETYTNGSFVDLEADFQELLDALEADLD